MRLDHIVFAAGPGGLAVTTELLGEQLGEAFRAGGVHPRFGTRNMILPLAGDIYVEIVEVLDHPASDKAPFGQAVRARSALVYSVLRLLFFLVPFGIMMLFPIFREYYWLAAIFAALIGLSLSLLFLRRPHSLATRITRFLLRIC